MGKRKKNKQKSIVVVPESKESRGHYNYKDGACQFDSRPKRQRTRAAQRKNWEREYD